LGKIMRKTTKIAAPSAKLTYRIRATHDERLRREALDRRYAEAYRRWPEKAAWGKLGAKLLTLALR